MLPSVIGSKAARPVARAEAALGDHTITGRSNWRVLSLSGRLLLGAGPESQPRRYNSEHGNQKQRRDRASHGTPPFTQGMDGTTEGAARNHDHVQVGVFSQGTPLAVTPLQCKPPLACPTSCFTSRRPPGRPQPIARSLRCGHLMRADLNRFTIEVAIWRSPRRSAPRRQPAKAARRRPPPRALRSTLFSPRSARSSARRREGGVAD